MNSIKETLEDIELMEKARGRVSVILFFIGALGMVSSFVATIIFPHLKDSAFMIGFLSIALMGLVMLYWFISYSFLKMKKKKKSVKKIEIVAKP